MEWPIPVCKKDLEAFLGFMNYHREFIPHFSDISHCLYQLTRKDATFNWSMEQQTSFEKLKELATSDLVLAFPTPDDPFILDADASDVAVGAVLIQVQEGIERPVCFASKILNPAQRKYCTTR